MGVLRNIINFDELMKIVGDAWDGATQTPSDIASTKVQGFCITTNTPTTWQPDDNYIIEGVYISASTWDKHVPTDSLTITVNNEIFIKKTLLAEPQYFETAKTISPNSVVSLVAASESVRHIFIDFHYKQLPKEGGANI